MSGVLPISAWKFIVKLFLYFSHFSHCTEREKGKMPERWKIWHSKYHITHWFLWIGDIPNTSFKWEYFRKYHRFFDSPIFRAFQRQSFKKLNHKPKADQKLGQWSEFWPQLQPGFANVVSSDCMLFTILRANWYFGPDERGFRSKRLSLVILDSPWL